MPASRLIPRLTPRLKHFLGIEVARRSSGIFLSQQKYTLNIISDAGLLGSKLASTPIEQNHQLAQSTSPLLSDLEPYRRLVGNLIYLFVIRPDLACSIHILPIYACTSRGSLECCFAYR